MANNELKEIFKNLIRLTIEARQQGAEELLIDLASTLNKQQSEFFFDCVVETGNIYLLRSFAVQVPEAPVVKIAKAIVQNGTFVDKIEFARDCIAYKLPVSEDLKEAILGASSKEVKELSKYDSITYRDVVEILNPDLFVESENE